MKKRQEIRVEKLAYRERTKVKITNQKERVKSQTEIVKRAKEETPMDWGWKASLIQHLIPVGLMALKELLESEVQKLAGAWYGRGGKYFRWGKNPGWVYLGEQKVKMGVPRVRSKDGEEKTLESYRAMQDPKVVDALTLSRVISGISQRKYERAVLSVPETFGIKHSSISRRFVRASAYKLRAFLERDLSPYDIVAIVLDGKTYARHQMVIALGITLEGEKILLGFVEAGTENYKVCRDFLVSLQGRGLKTDQEILFVVDGAKGLKKGVQTVFGPKAWIQRCQWHKRENVVSYLNKGEQEVYRHKLQAAYEEPTYEKAKGRLLAIHRELEFVNLSAAASLEEGLEETLTLHKLGLFRELGISLKTTNMLENVNRLLEMTTGRVNYWSSSGHRQRWIATALLEIEPRLRPIKGCMFLPALRHAMNWKTMAIQNEYLKNAA